MSVTMLILAACLSVPPVEAASRKGVEIIGEAMSQHKEPLKPDKFGFMRWQYSHPSSIAGVMRIESVTAKLTSIKGNAITIRTNTGQTLKLTRDQVKGRQLVQWLDAEFEKQDAKKAKKLNPEP